MFDPNNHYIDPATGFARHKDTGHLIGLEQAPPLPANPDREWPKMVPVHESHVVRQKLAPGQPAPAEDAAKPEVLAVPGWPEYHVNRADGAVMVVVHNEDEAKLAAGERQEVKPEDAVADDEVIRRQVRADLKKARLAAHEAYAKQAAVDDAKIEDEEVARRIAEKTEREAREKEAADKIADEQRKRMDEASPHAHDRDVRENEASARIAEDERRRHEAADRAVGKPIAPSPT